MFRVIALRLFKGCGKHIVKALHTDTTYFFYHDYEDYYNGEDRWIGLRRCSAEGIVPNDFFRLDDESPRPVISISAIVGKNGDGKSTIIEAIIRIVNNFAVKAGFLENQESLVMANNMFGVLFFEVNDYLHRIQCEGEKITLDGKLIAGDKNAFKGKIPLFYTIVDNLSTYAYNSRIFSKESDQGCWINGVFHKTILKHLDNPDGIRFQANGKKILGSQALKTEVVEIDCDENGVMSEQAVYQQMIRKMLRS